MPSPEEGKGHGPREARVVRGVVRCPRCDGRLVGYADVTLHPTILVRDGRLVLGPKVDTAAMIKRGIEDARTAVFDDELYCEHACGFRLHAEALRAQLRGEENTRGE